MNGWNKLKFNRDEWRIEKVEQQDPPPDELA